MTSKTVNPQTRQKRKSAPKATKRLWSWGVGAAAVGALAASALVNRRHAKQAEQDNPPLGKFLTVDGVRLHYLERGQGDPIVLLHGNGTMIEDWIVSDLFDELAKSRRVIAFDRPGFGHSERPRSRIWTPPAQAALLAKALAKLKVENATVVGHSFGTLVASALALDHPDSVAKLVLLAGYYFPSARADVLLAGQPAIPVVGDLMRHTISPVIGAALTPRVNAKIFSPAPVSKRWEEEFPLAMTLRPSQIRAEAAEAAMMIPAAAMLAPRWPDLTLPVTIVAGGGDQLVTTADQSERLDQVLPNSRCVTVDGAGHMVHHSASERVRAAIRQD